MQFEHVIQMARDLSLSGVADPLERQQADPLYAGISFTERLGGLLIAEKERRLASKLKRMMNEAKFPFRAAPEELIVQPSRGFKPDEMRELLRCGWLPHGWNILITGETGTGKSWLAICIATAAIRAGYSARYFKTSDLLCGLAMTVTDGIYLSERQKLLKYRLIVLDDFGLIGMSEREKSILFELIEDRSAGRRATIIVGQRPFNDWHAFIDNPGHADAIMDRLSRDRYIVKLRGDSLRRREASFSET